MSCSPCMTVREPAADATRMMIEATWMLLITAAATRPTAASLQIHVENRRFDAHGPRLVPGDSPLFPPPRPSAVLESCRMDAGSLRAVGFGAPQDFSGDGGDFADT